MIARRTLLATLAALALAGPAAAQNYPARVIKLVVPYTPGSPNDVMARLLTQHLQPRLGQPIVVDNKPGGGTVIGTKAAAAAEPDGYTLLISPPGPIAINQHLFSGLRFDPAAFVPVTIIAGAPNILVTRPGLAANLPELIALARSQPGKLTYGSPGKGSTPHLSAELLKSLSGIEMTHVPYKSVPDAMRDVMSGQVELTFGTQVDALALIQSGRLKALGTGGTTRSPLLSDVPAISETLPGFVSTVWYAAVAPPKTPNQIVEKLSAAMSEVLRGSESMAKLQTLQSTPVLNSPVEASGFIAAESERWRKVIVAAGLKPE